MVGSSSLSIVYTEPPHNANLKTGNQKFLFKLIFVPWLKYTYMYVYYVSRLNYKINTHNVCIFKPKEMDLTHNMFLSHDLVYGNSKTVCLRPNQGNGVQGQYAI